MYTSAHKKIQRSAHGLQQWTSVHTYVPLSKISALFMKIVLALFGSQMKHYLPNAMVFTRQFDITIWSSLADRVRFLNVSKNTCKSTQSNCNHTIICLRDKMHCKLYTITLNAGEKKKVNVLSFPVILHVKGMGATRSIFWGGYIIERNDHKTVLNQLFISPKYYNISLSQN